MEDFVRRTYEILKVPEDASMEEVDRAYRALVAGTGKNWEEIKEIEEAYEALATRLTPHAGPEHEKALEEGASVRYDDTLWDRVKDLILPAEEEANPFVLGARAFFFLLIVAWGVKFIFAPLSEEAFGCSFMHLINLPFHEAGHVIFAILGDFLRVLGGSIMQVLVPLVCMAAFLRKGDTFGASFALWWAGQSLMDLALYIYDARAGELMLLGGVTGQEAPDFHDWHNILSRLALLNWDHALAYGAKYTGVLLMLLAFVWGGVTLARQYRSLKGKG